MNHQTLKAVLKANAMFSFCCGAILLLAAPSVSNWMGGHPHWIYQGLGAGLILFAADLLWVATRRKVNRTFAILILWADIAWVVGSALLLILGHHLLSSEGQITVLAIAIIVGVFSVLERKSINGKHLDLQNA